MVEACALEFAYNQRRDQSPSYTESLTVSGSFEGEQLNGFEAEFFASNLDDFSQALPVQGTLIHSDNGWKLGLDHFATGSDDSSYQYEFNSNGTVGLYEEIERDRYCSEQNEDGTCKTVESPKNSGNRYRIEANQTGGILQITDENFAQPDKIEKTVNTLDEQGRLLVSTRFEGDAKIEVQTWEYNDTGVAIKFSEDTNGDGTNDIVTTTELSDDGRISKKTKDYADASITDETIDYEYDDRGALLKTTHKKGSDVTLTHSYEYFDSGNLKMSETIYADGRITTRTFNENYDPLEEITVNDQGIKIRQVSIAYDDYGRITSYIIDSDGDGEADTAWGKKRDEQGRLIESWQIEQTREQFRKRFYYDDAGRLDSIEHTRVNYDNDKNAQVEDSTVDDVLHYVYDAQGRLTSIETEHKPDEFDDQFDQSQANDIVVVHYDANGTITSLEFSLQENAAGTQTDHQANMHIQTSCE